MNCLRPNADQVRPHAVARASSLTPTKSKQYGSLTACEPVALALGESHEHISRLLADLAVFTSVNTLLFALTGALAFVARARGLPLLVPSTLLLLSTFLAVRRSCP